MIATTVALVAVFIPVAFLTGTVGRLFREFGITLAVAVVISVVRGPDPDPDALLPHPAAPWPPTGTSAGPSAPSTPSSSGLDRTYAATLRWSLRFSRWCFGGGLLLVAVSVWLFGRLPEELVPTEDRGIAFGIVIAPEGATLDYTDRYMRQIEDDAAAPARAPRPVHRHRPRLRRPRPRDQRLRLPEPEAARPSASAAQQEIVGQLFPRLLGIPGVLAFLINPPSLGGRFSSSAVRVRAAGRQLRGAGPGRAAR